MDYMINFPNLHIFLKHVGKSVSIGNFPIAYYGIVIALGMLGGIYLASYVAKKTGQDPDMYFDLAMVEIVCAIICARIYYVAFQWDYYKDNLLSIFNLRGGGIAIYGGVIGGVLATWGFARIKKVKTALLLDTACYGLVLGQIMGRWGNFFNREAFGEYTNNLFAMQLPVSAVRANEITALQMEHMVEIDGVSFIQVHPTFLYESLWNTGVLILLFLALKYKKFDGELFLLYLLAYGAGRFWIEGLRTDQLLMPVIHYPVSKALAAVLVVVSAAWILIKRRKIHHNPPPVPEEKA